MTRVVGWADMCGFALRPLLDLGQDRPVIEWDGALPLEQIAGTVGQQRRGIGVLAESRQTGAEQAFSVVSGPGLGIALLITLQSLATEHRGLSIGALLKFHAGESYQVRASGWRT